MRLRRLLALAGGAVALAAATAAAQPRDYVIDAWSPDRGLPTSFVTSIAQTPDGYLWVGTQNGLLRFDGVRFVTFDPDNTPALAHARVEHLFVDAAGTPWANTYDGSLTSIRDGVFRHEWTGSGPVDFEAFLAPSRDGEAAFVLDRGGVIHRGRDRGAPWQVWRPPGGALPLFTDDADGALWVRGVDERLWRLRDGRFTEVPRQGLTGTTIRVLARDAGGRVWVGTDAEIAVFTGGRFEVMTPANGEPRLDVSTMRFAADGSLWVVANGRVRQARGRTWVWSDDGSHGLSGPSVRLHEDRQGGVWCWHNGKGVLHVRADGRSRWLTDAEGLPGTRVRDLLEDREGNIWLAIERGGLARVRDAWFEVHTVAGQSDLAVSSIAEARDGSLWIGSLGGGVERRRHGIATQLALPRATAGGFVFSVQPDAGGRIWLSADQEDLFYVDGDRIRRAPVQVHGIKTMLADADGGLWLGTKSGLSRLDRGRLHVFGPEDGFERRDVRALARGPDGAIWIGTGDGTIYRHRAGDPTLARFTPPGAKPVQTIWSLDVDAAGTVWAGTFRGGLLRLRDGQFTRYTTERGLPSNIVCQVIEDDAGQMWLGSANGIVRVAKAALEASPAAGLLPVVRYGRSDGLPTLECSGNYQPSAARTRDGRLWFATPRGLVSVNPHAAAVTRTPPLVVLEDVLVDQRPVSIAAPAASLAAGTGPGGSDAAPGALRIPPGQHRLEFHYTGLTFATPDQVRFRYRIDGLESDWVDAGTQRVAHYGYVPPGRYRFRVSASHGDGRWSTREASLAFVVLPRFYERRAVQGTFAVGALVVVGLIVRVVSTRRLRRRVERLEMLRAVDRDRDRIARDIHDDLGAGLTQITLLSEIARREPPEDVTGPLGQISETARELTRAMDEIVWAVNPRHDSLDALVTYICQFAQEYLTIAGVQCRLDVPSSLTPHALTADVRHSLFLAVKEALNNIAKHARARVVWIRLVERERGFRLTIEDDGVGFDEDAVLAHAAAARATPGRPNAGQGLRNLRERLASIGGRCDVTSAPGRGTQVSLEMDLS
jgi:signal transduction histidine kinase/ligand-binding sensor domain-containing protein